MLHCGLRVSYSAIQFNIQRKKENVFVNIRNPPTNYFLVKIQALSLMYFTLLTQESVNLESAVNLEQVQLKFKAFRRGLL